MAGERAKWILLAALFLALTLSVVANTSEGNKQKREAETEPEKLKRFQVVAWNFPHVETPYIISLWIVLASVAKIGK